MVFTDSNEAFDKNKSVVLFFYCSKPFDSFSSSITERKLLN